MKTSWPLEPMSPKEIPFAERVAAAEFMVDRVGAMSRLFNRDHTERTETLLAGCMVEIRNTCVAVRDSLGFFEYGPRVLIDGEPRLAFAEFAEGARLTTALYMSVQESRLLGMEWRAIKDGMETPLKCLVLLNEFLTLAQAAKQDTSMELSRKKLQLHRDSKRSKKQVVNDGELTKTDVTAPQITAKELSVEFGVSEKTVKNELAKEGIKYVVRGAGNIPHRFDEQQARAVMDNRKKRKGIL